MPRKLGQHFLRHEGTVKKMANAIPASARTIIEIGPGHGELTHALTAAHPSVEITLIERDANLIPWLVKRLAGSAVRIEEGDALDILPDIATRIDDAYAICGNIPYYITGHLFRILSELPNPPETAVFLIQKEVAERATAAPPHMNRLAASIQVWAEPQIIAIVPRKHFNPPPKVDSAVLLLAKRKTIPPLDERMRYFNAMRILFAQPRKTLLNNLSAIEGITREKALSLLEKLGLQPTKRPHDLAIDAILGLAQRI